MTVPNGTTPENDTPDVAVLVTERRRWADEPPAALSRGKFPQPLELENKLYNAQGFPSIREGNQYLPRLCLKNWNHPHRDAWYFAGARTISSPEAWLSAATAAAVAGSP